MYGYQRLYQVWKYDSGIYRGDQNNFWDSDYWLSFNMNLRTNISDESIFAKREPNKELFLQFASTGKNGGGLCSPQAPGCCILYYDTNHLAFVDTIPSAQNESEAVNILRTVGGEYFELDENHHIKQPWSNKVSTGNTRSEKMELESINPDKRWSGVYSSGSTTWPDAPSERWWGRAAYNYRQSVDAGQKHIVFGPHTLHPGDKLYYSMAEVVGYGARAGKAIEGGQTLTQWAKTPSWNRPVKFGNDVVTQHYLDDFGYPDYVNSKVVTVTDVTHKAFQAYLGVDSAGVKLPVWPEDNPNHGSYLIPVPVPAPVIDMRNTNDGLVKIIWNRSVEAFTHPRLMGALKKFYIYRSDAGMGPWTLKDSLHIGDVNADDLYEYLDTNQAYKNEMHLILKLISNR